MMTGTASVTGPFARWGVTRADYIVVLLAVIAYVSAGWIARLHETEGPPAQRVHIRWAPNVSPDERVRAEQELTLLGGEHLDGRTWRYFLPKRSRNDIRRLLGRSEERRVGKEGECWD